MRLRLLACCVLITALATTLSAQIQGGWTATAKDDGLVYISMSSTGCNSCGWSFKLTELTSLSESAMRAPQTTPAKFELRRDAGTFAFDGAFRSGFGGGAFTFTPNPAFVEAIRALGPDERRPERSLDDQAFSFAMIGVTTERLQWLHKTFPNSSLHEVRKMAAAGVTPALIDDLAAAGYRNLSTRDLIRLAATGVDGDFIRKMSRYRTSN